MHRSKTLNEPLLGRNKIGSITLQSSMVQDRSNSMFSNKNHINSSLSTEPSMISGTIDTTPKLLSTNKEFLSDKTCIRSPTETDSSHHVIKQSTKHNRYCCDNIPVA